MSSNYHETISNYANFRIFSETLQAGVLDAVYENAIMDYRESHRGTMVGMTRFRNVVDDMPIMGYGWGNVNRDRIESFHSLLAGHSANYLSRGTFWGTEQRRLLDVYENRYRNPGIGGEDASFCMVSSVPVSYWVRWMLVQESFDEKLVYIARAVPKRWFASGETFGIADAPTRFGVVTYSMQTQNQQVVGSLAVQPNPQSSVKDALYAIRVRSAVKHEQLSDVDVEGGKVVSLFPQNNTVVIKLHKHNIKFNASFSMPSIVA